MTSVSLQVMKQYLSKSIASFNTNKLNGLKAEIDFRNYLSTLGWSDRISPGGWILRSVGASSFGRNTIVIFPETIKPDMQYPSDRNLQDPPARLHSICNHFHAIGIVPYYAMVRIEACDDFQSIRWFLKRLGVPMDSNYEKLSDLKLPFDTRLRRYQYLRYKTNIDSIPTHAIAEEFSKEHLRVSVNSKYLSETSDIDGVIWGSQKTYPIEIKEKTVAKDGKVGEYFGIDVGPFVKLAFYAAKRGNMHSLFIVREIDDVINRKLMKWWAITFEKLAQYASWIPTGGGKSMTGGASHVVKIPKAEFDELDKNSLELL